jgi:hypothetical protein
VTRKIDQFIRNRLSASAAADGLLAQEEDDRRARFAHALGKDTLYRYRGLEGEQRGYTIDIIVNHRVYLSSPAQFNDPFDCVPSFALGGDPKDPQFVQKLLRHQDELRGKLSDEETLRLASAQRVDVDQLPGALEANIRDDMYRRTRVLCLSGKHLHPLCWAHYASKHSGICLHFSTQPKSIFRGASKMLYQKAREPIVIDGGPPGDEAYDKTVLTKAEFWNYEDEYRIVTMRDGPLEDQFDGNGCIAFPPEVLCGITLGMRIRDDDRREIIGIARAASPQIPLWQARMHPTDFWMIQDPIA